VSEAAAEPKVGPKKSPKAKDGKRNIFSRIALFWRQVISELKKVVSPSRKELLKLTGVVLVFVAIVMVFIGVVDFLIGHGVFWLLA
jgi:preprotein translocase subunit SecE